MNDLQLSHNTAKTYGRSAAPMLEELEARGVKTVTTQELARLRGLDAGSSAFRSLIRRLTDNNWLVATSLRGVYEFVPLRAGRYSAGDPLAQLRSLAQRPNAPRFQIALGTAAFLRGYADTPAQHEYLLFDKGATFKPGLRRSFKVIRTDNARLFGAHDLNGVPVSTASRLFIDAALYWRHAGDLRLRNHWLAAAGSDADPELVSQWARTLGPSTVARVGYLAERFNASQIAERFASGVVRNTRVVFGDRSQATYDARWHTYDAVGIASKE